MQDDTYESTYKPCQYERYWEKITEYERETRRQEGRIMQGQQKKERLLIMSVSVTKIRVNTVNMYD